MRYTVLGATSFIGKRLVAALQADGHGVFAPARGDASVFSSDLGCVFYCVGMTANYAVRPAATVEAHAGLLSRLIEQAHFEHIVYLSSTRLYDDTCEAVGSSGTILQIEPHKARHLYDLTKALGENLCLTATGGRGSVARLSGVFDWSPGSPGFLSEWMQRAARERAFTLESSSGFVRDYVHVDDAVTALRSLSQAAPHDIWNIASGENVSNADIADIYNQRGWRIAFARETARQTLPLCDVQPLAANRVKPRPVSAIIEHWIERIAAREAH